MQDPGRLILIPQSALFRFFGNGPGAVRVQVLFLFAKVGTSVLKWAIVLTPSIPLINPYTSPQEFKLELKWRVQSSSNSLSAVKELSLQIPSGFSVNDRVSPI